MRGSARSVRCVASPGANTAAVRAIPHRGSLSVWEWLRLVRWCRRAEHRPDVAALEECGGHPAVALLYLAERT